MARHRQVSQQGGARAQSSTPVWQEDEKVGTVDRAEHKYASTDTEGLCVDGHAGSGRGRLTQSPGRYQRADVRGRTELDARMNPTRDMTSDSGFLPGQMKSSSTYTHQSRGAPEWGVFRDQPCFPWRLPAPPAAHQRSAYSEDSMTTPLPVYMYDQVTSVYVWAGFLVNMPPLGNITVPYVAPAPLVHLPGPPQENHAMFLAPGPTPPWALQSCSLNPDFQGAEESLQGPHSPQGAAAESVKK